MEKSGQPDRAVRTVSPIGWIGGGLSKGEAWASGTKNGFLFEVPLSLFRLPAKLHVEAPWLSDECYVGSAQNPIVFGPFVVGAPGNFELANDPNRLPVEILTLTDLPLEDKTVAIPRAHGCGHGEANSEAKANAKVDELLGLPSAAGLNRMVFAHADFAFVAAGFDDTAPDGGAQLQAAFEAAK